MRLLSPGRLRLFGCALLGLPAGGVSAGSTPAVRPDAPGIPSRELMALEASLAGKAKRIPAAVRERLSRGEPQDVVVLLFSSDVEGVIMRQSVTRGEARRLRAERYARVKRAALSPLRLESQVAHEYTQLPLVHLRVTSLATLERLLERPEVAAVYENARVRLQLNESLPLIGQPAAAAAGHRGAGTTVAVLDSGVDYTRAAFGFCTAPGQPVGCKVIVSEDFAAPDNQLDAPERHGTLVSGIVLGVAPDTRLAVLDVFDGEQGSFTAILAGLDWAIVNRDRYDIAAVNMSFGGDIGVTAPCEDGGYTPAVQLLRTESIVSVVASGNNGFSNELGAPACTPGAVSVGAVYDANVGPVNTTVCNDPTTQVDQITCYSDSASFLTLLAPGDEITAAGLTGGGTSLSAPFVAGAAAVLRGAYPGEIPTQIVHRMTTTGVPVTDPRNNVTVPRLALDRALAAPTPPLPPPPVACSAQRLTCPSTIAGNLTTSSCGTGRLSRGHFADVYEFSGVTGQTVTITMSTGLPGDVLDPHLVLISPSGQIAAINDDIALGEVLNSRIVFTLAESGTWRVEASTFAPGMVGEYSIGISGCTAPMPSVCTPGPTTLCLSGGRFRVQANWRATDGRTGAGNAVPLTADTGYFWFFEAANVEMITKVLNACGVNQRIWVFGGGLTNVEVTMTVEDTTNGFLQSYRNPQGAAFLPIQDTQAFATCAVTPATATAMTVSPETFPKNTSARHAAYLEAKAAAYGQSAACTPEANALCLSGGRFRVTAAWQAADGRSGVGNAVGLTADTGYFWFFDRQNVEMIVKVLNACSVNQRIWTFAGGLTNVEVTMTVEDTNTGAVRTYRNPQGTAFAPVQDTGAFATCP
ncbi:MAG: S8 family serine peptidase [Thermoanaerobaculia bacterium]